MSTLSIFDAARETPSALALSDGQHTLSFAALAERTGPLAATLAREKPPALALTPRADVESLLWLYAAFATGTPVLTLHSRATAQERSRDMARAGAVEVPAPPTSRFEETSWSEPPDSAPLALIPTSGSTGTPRLVELSRRAVLASARASALNLGWQDDDRWLLCLPLAHAGGLSIVTRCLLARKPVLLFEAGPNGALKQAAELAHAGEHATLVSLVPSLLEALLDTAGFPGPKLRAVLLGGSGCSPALARRAHAARLPLLTSYGLTETASQVVTRPYAERFEPLPEQRGCVSSGTPLRGVELRLDQGRISVRAPSLLTRYLGEREASLDTDGWLVTSDRGELGPQGELYVRGRFDDVIITAGENVDPLEVEAALRDLPGIRDACVFATPSRKFGQVVTAAIVCDDARLADAHHLAGLLADRLARHKCPRRALRTDSLPLTASGKVDRLRCAALWTDIS